MRAKDCPCAFAACWGDAEVVLESLAHGADPNQREDRGAGSSPLLWAAKGGHAETVDVLLKAEADPNLADEWGRTPLLFAAERGSVAVVKLLLSSGADPNRADDEGRTALEAAQDWLGKDAEEELRKRVAAFGAEGDEIVVRREPRADGVELVEVIAESPDKSGWGWEVETGHAQITEILRERSK